MNFGNFRTMCAIAFCLVKGLLFCSNWQGALMFDFAKLCSACFDRCDNTNCVNNIRRAACSGVAPLKDTAKCMKHVPVASKGALPRSKANGTSVTACTHVISKERHCHRTFGRISSLCVKYFLRFYFIFTLLKTVCIATTWAREATGTMGQYCKKQG